MRWVRGFREDYGYAFWCLPLQTVSLCIFVTSALGVGFTLYSLIHPSDDAATNDGFKKATQFFTIVSLLIAALAALITMTLFLPLAGKLLFHGYISTVFSQVLEIIVLWILFFVAHDKEPPNLSNAASTRPPKTPAAVVPFTKTEAFLILRTVLVLFFVILSFCCVWHWLASLHSVLCEGGTGWECLPARAIRKTREAGFPLGGPLWARRLHKKLGVQARTIPSAPVYQSNSLVLTDSMLQPVESNELDSLPDSDQYCFDDQDTQAYDVEMPNYSRDIQDTSHSLQSFNTISSKLTEEIWGRQHY